MHPPAPPSVERLSRYLSGDDAADPMTDELAGWLAASPRFRTFAEEHRDKIRKKLRGAKDADARLDVRAELRVASLLVADRRISLAFEAHGSTRGGPDFLVSFRDHTAFCLEVTRLRRRPHEAVLARVVLAKLRQLPPSVASVVLLGVDGNDPAEADVAGAIRTIRRRADAKDDAFLSRGGFDGPRELYARFFRLGVVVVWCEAGVEDGRAAVWVNPSARLAVPERALRALVAVLR